MVEATRTKWCICRQQQILVFGIMLLSHCEVSPDGFQALARCFRLKIKPLHVLHLSQGWMPYSQRYPLCNQLGPCNILELVADKPQPTLACQPTRVIPGFCLSTCPGLDLKLSKDDAEGYVSMTIIPVSCLNVRVENEEVLKSFLARLGIFAL